MAFVSDWSQSKACVEFWAADSAATNGESRQVDEASKFKQAFEIHLDLLADKFFGFPGFLFGSNIEHRS